MAPQPRFKQMLAASRDEAQLAVRLYNDPAEARSFDTAARGRMYHSPIGLRIGFCIVCSDCALPWSSPCRRTISAR